jgi:hypothetical protein
MAIMPRGVAQPMELMKSLNAFGPFLPPEVVNWRFNIDNDWSGEPALFFWITLSDEAARRDRLPDVTERVNNAINERLNPFYEWGLIPYVSFRSQSEQNKLQESIFG